MTAEEIKPSSATTCWAVDHEAARCNAESLSTRLRNVTRVQARSVSAPLHRMPRNTQGAGMSDAGPGGEGDGGGT
jgi:hypothetical protein